MPVIIVTRLRLRAPALLDEFFTDAVAALEQAWQERRRRPHPPVARKSDPRFPPARPAACQRFLKPWKIMSQR